MGKIFVVILFSFFLCANGLAHGDLHERIVKVTEEIKMNPENSFLYLKRGKLYFHHHDFTKSLKDLKTSQKLGLKSSEQYYLLAKNYIKLGRLKNSEKFINKILRNEPCNVNTLKLQGEVYFKRKKFKMSAIAFQKVIKYSKESFPQNYINASNSWLALDTVENWKHAQSVLLEGIQDLGNNIVLYNKLISINVDKEDYSAAIKYQKEVIEFSSRKERGYLKLAGLQILQKNYGEASKSLSLAKEHFSRLPNRIKGTTFMKDFYNKLESKERFIKKELLNSL